MNTLLYPIKDISGLSERLKINVPAMQKTKYPNKYPALIHTDYLYRKNIMGKPCNTYTGYILKPTRKPSPMASFAVRGSAQSPTKYSSVTLPSNSSASCLFVS